MKWKPLEPTQGQFTTAIPDAMIAWARAHNIRYRCSNNNNNNSNNNNTINSVRGHSLLWAKQWNNPAWLWALQGEQFSSAVYSHLDQTLDHFNSLGNATSCLNG